MSGREAVYGLLSASGLVIPWFFNVQYVTQGGSLVDIAAFFRLGFVNAAASSLTSDLLIAFAVFVLWAVLESRRLGMRAGWIYPLLGFLVSFAFAFPLFLLQRERHLRMTAGGG